MNIILSNSVMLWNKRDVEQIDDNRKKQNKNALQISNASASSIFRNICSHGVTPIMLFRGEKGSWYRLEFLSCRVHLNTSVYSTTRGFITGPGSDATICRLI